MSDRLTILLLLAIGLGNPVAPTAGAQTRNAPAIYVLFAVGAHQLPIIISRIVPGEGTTLRSARLELMSDGRLHGRMAVSFTDSGTVTDTILIEGRWVQTGDSLRLTYQWSRPRWQPGPRVFETGRRVNGRLAGSELTLPNLALLDEELFRKATVLHFRRVR